MVYGVRIALLAGLAGLVGCAPEAPVDVGADEDVAETQEDLSLGGDFDANYVGCDEFAGVGLVPLANVVDRVPPGYTVIEAAPGAAIVVAQGGHCDQISVEGRWGRRGTFAQFGVGVVPPTGTGDGNFYQLMFATDHPVLATRLLLVGANARYAPGLDFDITSAPALSVSVPQPLPLAWRLDGPITLPDPSAPPNPVTTFNYWRRTFLHGNVLQQNVVTGIRFGEGSSVVLTAIGPEMEEIIGGTSLTFPFFSKPETFDRADVAVQTHVF